MQTFWLDYNGRRYALRQGESTVGRSPYSSIVVESTLASRHHAALRVQDDTLEISDLGSRNGTLVNGQPIRGRVRLSSGDCIGIGDDELTVVAHVEARGSKKQTLDGRRNTIHGDESHVARPMAPTIPEETSEIPVTVDEERQRK